MPPRDYLRAREDASGSNDDSFCAMIDGAPYFPNLVVGQAQTENSIKKVVEQLILQTAGTGGNLEPSLASVSLDSSTWTVSPVTGGNTNQLFCVSGICCGAHNNNSDNGNLQFAFPNDSLLVRLFGADGMIDRDDETSTYASLAHQKLALQYYGRFGNGRVEEMLVGWTTLTEDDLMGRAAASNSKPTSTVLPPVDLNESIARGLARLHVAFELPEHLLVEKNATDESKGPSLPEPTLWTQLYPWLERSLEASFRTDHDTERAKHGLDPPLSSLNAELEWLKSKVIGKSEKIGFCHNDLLASNIMMKTTTIEAPTIHGDESDFSTPDRLLLEDLQFIDFEYGGINYYAYDIANHFNEYAGGTAVEDNSTPDYSRCPDEQQKRAFLEAYADEYNQVTRSRSDGSSDSASDNITAEELGARVDGFSLANHLVWGLWGVLQAASEGCEDGLDYLHYAKCRFDQYKHDKRLKYGATVGQTLTS